MELAAVIILSEIMYNPASSERAPIETEWVELYNPTEQAVDLEGWYLQDEDGRTGPIPEGITLDPGEALVLIPGEQAVADFRKGWGGGRGGEAADYQVVPLKDWGAGGLRNLANSPSEENEVLTLRRADESVSDEVNYDDREPWPRDEPEGHSIYLLPKHLTAQANDDGAHWARSEPARHGADHARNPSDYATTDIGSPGVVATETDERHSDADANQNVRERNAPKERDET